MYELSYNDRETSYTYFLVNGPVVELYYLLSHLCAMQNDLIVKQKEWGRYFIGSFLTSMGLDYTKVPHCGLLSRFRVISPEKLEFCIWGQENDWSLTLNYINERYPNLMFYKVVDPNKHHNNDNLQPIIK